MGGGDHTTPPLCRPQTERWVRSFLARRGFIAAATLGRGSRGIQDGVEMWGSQRHDPSKAGRPLSAKTNVLQVLEAIPKRPPCVGMAHTVPGARTFQNALRKAFTGEAAMLTVETRLAKSEKIPWRLIEEEAILLDLDEGEVLRLNPVGAEIWSAIDGRHTVEEIVAHIRRTFEVSHWTARRDVHRFLKQLLRHALVEER